MATQSSTISPMTLLWFGLALIIVGWPVRVVVHEFGHAIVAMMLGAQSSVWINVSLYSGWTSWSGDVPVWQHVVISLAGTALVCVAAWLMVNLRVGSPLTQRFLQLVALIWVVSEFINMSPIWNTDGDYLAGVWGDYVQWGVLLLLAGFGACLFMQTAQDKKTIHVAF